MTRIITIIIVLTLGSVIEAKPSLHPRINNLNESLSMVVGKGKTYNTARKDAIAKVPSGKRVVKTSYKKSGEYYYVTVYYK